MAQLIYTCSDSATDDAVSWSGERAVLPGALYSGLVFEWARHSLARAAPQDSLPNFRQAHAIAHEAEIYREQQWSWAAGGESAVFLGVHRSSTRTRSPPSMRASAALSEPNGVEAM
jgi:hypothetical protein